ncbi:hypothetical protein BOX15_Mlig016896g3 [Macrostomum lignano]|uniref:EF-hand domain-containing protein 1 n=2 Tax=Macrostomum lignano TaxID=282301 RepID=A0A1I8HKJ3_9PLAT|nr:hypothetical protein BOX15_Mlig016896g1 [Macrostomum lignano]PAA86469.1 hypothetical protein BOX15_Mlig016896g3 [Macrostomum lignano]
MEGLPFLPGNTFKDPTKTKHHVSQSLGYKNGYQVPKAYPTVGIGGQPLPVNQLTESELDELANFQPTLTYGKAKQAPPEAFVPAHVAFDKKVLRFYGYFKETVHESPQEYYRVRPVVFYYYLEDDSIAIVEPPKENSGIPQGKFIKRQRVPKNDVGDHYTWKDINLSQNVSVYGRVFRITDCDQFTRSFLESEGVEVNQPESIPADPYLVSRSEATALKTYKTPTAFDKLKQFIELDRKVLRFFALWDDTASMYGEARPFIIHYYLVDDTLEIREVHQTNDGRDPFPVLIRRGRVPKDRFNLPNTFPSVALELSDAEVKDYFTPRDFVIGETVVINGRRFVLYDCDNFTKAWYYQHFGVTEFNCIDVSKKFPGLASMEIPPYNKFGSLEDSMQNVVSIVPEPPKKDFVKMMEQGTTQLRYEAMMDSIRPEDKNRRFIISYRLADDMVNIYETPTRNSGIPGGNYLKRARVAKPNSTPEKPQYYGPADFGIGAKINIFGQRFVITNCDAFVLKYMEQHPAQFPSAVVDSVRAKLSENESRNQDAMRGGMSNLRRTEGDLFRLVSEVKSQLKRLGITDKARIDEMFLKYNTDRLGYIDVSKLQDLCKKMILPYDEDICAAIVNEFGSDGRMDLEQWRRFIEG